MYYHLEKVHNWMDTLNSCSLMFLETSTSFLQGSGIHFQVISSYKDSYKSYQEIYSWNLSLILEISHWGRNGVSLAKTENAIAATVTSVVPNSVQPHRQQPTRLPSLGFPRQEYWSGFPFPSPVHENEK